MKQNDGTAKYWWAMAGIAVFAFVMWAYEDGDQRETELTAANDDEVNAAISESLDGQDDDATEVASTSDAGPEETDQAGSILYNLLNGGAKETSAADPAEGKSEPVSAGCRSDDECWATAHRSEAIKACTEAVDQMMSATTTRWTEGMLEWRFDRYRWSNADQGVMTYISNAMEIELAPDEWVASLVECDFDGDTDEVVDVRQS